MKTAVFVVIVIAALGAMGVTTAIMSSATPAHAQCTIRQSNPHITVCSPSQGSGGQVCTNNPGQINCRDTGRQ